MQGLSSLKGLLEIVQEGREGLVEEGERGRMRGGIVDSQICGKLGQSSVEVELMLERFIIFRSCQKLHFERDFHINYYEFFLCPIFHGSFDS